MKASKVLKPITIIVGFIGGYLLLDDWRLALSVLGIWLGLFNLQIHFMRLEK